jgi:hypothetical protein
LFLVSLKSPENKIHQGENGGQMTAASLPLGEGIEDSNFMYSFSVFLVIFVKIENIWIWKKKIKELDQRPDRRSNAINLVLRIRSEGSNFNY